MTRTQEKVVSRRRAGQPTEHGPPTELWTASRLAPLIEQEFGITSTRRYLSAWLRGRGMTPSP